MIQPSKVVQQFIFWDKPNLKGLLSYLLWIIICKVSLDESIELVCLKGMNDE
jgi:hypothetical protein